MQYLDFDKLEAIDARAFRSTQPYPYINPQELLTEEGFEQLLSNMPDISLFEKKFGYERIAGQKPHDRYSLEYAPDTPVPAAWRSFIDELCSDRYRKKLASLFGARKINLRFHWHYTPNGCSSRLTPIRCANTVLKFSISIQHRTGTPPGAVTRWCSMMAAT